MSTRFEIGLAFSAENPSATAENFEAFLDLVMEELANIGHAEIDLVASLAKLTARFTEEGTDEAVPDGVSPGSLSEANDFLADLRTALHAARCGTANWRMVEQSLEIHTTQSDLLPA